MSRGDSTYSYIHHIDPKQVLHMEKWQDDPIPYGDVDTQPLIEASSGLFSQFMAEDEEDNDYPINPSIFGRKLYKNRRNPSDRVWSDLAVYDSFLNESSSLFKQKDNTILKSVHTNLEGLFESNDEVEGFSMAHFLSNGFAHEEVMDTILKTHDLNDSIIGGATGDLSLLSALELPVPHNTSMIGSSRIPSNPINTSVNAANQTPRMNRSRQPSSDRIFQTPITRIMR